MCGLSAIEKNFPAALPHLRNMYSDNPDLTDEEPRDSYTRAWYYGLEDGIQFIKCTNGFHQGDVLASWCYCMTIQQLLRDLRSHLKSKFPDQTFLIHYYVDDGN